MLKQQYQMELVELMGNPETLSWANELIDIETAFVRREITPDEARYLIMDLRDVRAPQAVKQPWIDSLHRVATVALKFIV